MLRHICQIFILLLLSILLLLLLIIIVIIIQPKLIGVNAEQPVTPGKNVNRGILELWFNFFT